LKTIYGNIKVIYESENSNYSGYYSYGSQELVITEGELVASTIAHELRHYMQYQVYPDMPGSDWATCYTEANYDYENAIQEYFLTQPTELDALIFEFKFAKTEINEWWLRKLVIENDSRRLTKKEKDRFSSLWK
jgi:hypothetical protein